MVKTQRASHYPDHIDKPHNGFENKYQEGKQMVKELLDAGVVLSCTAGYIKGSCSNAHGFVKAIYCGKEFCNNCGALGSVFHQRRVGRWLPKVLSLQKLGYLVVTIPEELRRVYQCAKELSSFRVALKRKLQRMGFDKGLMRWHLFGDCATCDGNGCRACYATGASAIYKPHLNVFIDSGFMAKEKFESFTAELKAFLVNYWLRNFAMALDANVYYSYTAKVPEKVNKVKYVTRATFRHYHKDLYAKLKGFRMMQTWGKWDACDHEQEDVTVTLEKNNCPCCKRVGLTNKIDWTVGRDFESKIRNKDHVLTGVVCSKLFGDVDVDEGIGLKKKKRKQMLLTHGEIINDFSITHIEAGYYVTEKIYNPMDSQLKVSKYLIQTMAELRHAQRGYFRTRSSFLLNRCKQLESKIDAMLFVHITEGDIVDPSSRYGDKKTTGDLFNS